MVWSLAVAAFDGLTANNHGLRRTMSLDSSRPKTSENPFKDASKIFWSKAKQIGNALTISKARSSPYSLDNDAKLDLAFVVLEYR
jgi:hypothetical protein